MPKLSFYQSRTARNRVVRSQQEKIREMYKNAHNELKKTINNMGNNLQRYQLMLLQNQIKEEINNITITLNEMYKQGVTEISQATVNDMKRFLNYVNVDTTEMMLTIPDRTVEMIMNGKIYDKAWYLSKRVWSFPDKAQKDAEFIISSGLSQNKDLFDIAKDLELYLDPVRKKPVEWSRYYKGVSGKIDYNAMRLARTLCQHSYQQTFVTVTRPNPFITMYRWNISSNDRVCPICQDREGNLYSKDNLPIDHPNGQCWWEAVIPETFEQIADRIADWGEHPENDPELDAYMQWLRNN